ncbi:MAG: biotin transporter BioY [bacterium]
MISSSSRRSFILAGLFAALTVFGAHIKIPLPYVSLTLQTFFVLLSGHLLGPLYGAASQSAYLLLGLIGLPVFAEGGGLAYVFKPTFGYLLGYPLASFTAGMIVHRGALQPQVLPAASLARLILANLSALFAIFVPGVVYLWWNLNFVLGQAFSFASAFKVGFLVFLPGDVIKIAGVIWLYRALQPRLAATFRFSTNTPILETTTTIAAGTEPRPD